MSFLSKYWKKIGLVVIGLFLTGFPLFFMLFAGLLIGHFVTSRFSYRIDVKVAAPRPKRGKPQGLEDEEILQHKEFIPEPKTKAEAILPFEHTEDEKEEEK